MAAAAVSGNPTGIGAPPPPHAVEAEAALVPASAETAREPAGGEIDRESVVRRMPVEVEVAVPLRDFRVRNLLALDAGDVVGSPWRQGEDLPLSAGEVQLAWVEFEVVDTTLAARITRPA